MGKKGVHDGDGMYFDRIRYDHFRAVVLSILFSKEKKNRQRKTVVKSSVRWRLWQ